jgi:L-tyrosine isonitrile synthase
MLATNIEGHPKASLVCSGRETATQILALVMEHRRLPSNRVECAQHRCEACVAPHFDRVMQAIQRREPITFVLPAFPGKSPNPAKVLGTRPDMAERQSLAFLNRLCLRLQKIYSPGARIVLCSDGRVFNDVVGIKDADITTYQQDLATLITELRAESLSTFNLDAVFGDRPFEETRSLLMAGYGETVEAVQAEARSGGEAQSMYRGITRFLFEDALRPDMTISRTALQKDCKRRAYEVIVRSRAWDRLLAERFPGAVRLSIHPQACGGRKIGIHLLETKDEWLTAWHSVAVEVRGRFKLMKREHVERLGAELVFQDGRPSHYVMAASAEEEQ